MKKGQLKFPKVYIAGPMTGYEEHNFPEFRLHAKHLRNYGYDVVSPEELESMETGPRKSWEYYLTRDLKALLTCDCIAVLPGWEKSRGASLEVYVGWRLGFEIFDARDFSKVDVSKYDFSRIQNETNAQSFIRVFTPPKMERELPLAPFASDMLQDKPKENILEEANRLVHGDRGQAYGHPAEDFKRTAGIWSHILGFEVPVEKVALCMVGVKISRQCNAPKRDNWTDMAGYAETGYMVDKKLGRME